MECLNFKHSIIFEQTQKISRVYVVIVYWLAKVVVKFEVLFQSYFVKFLIRVAISKLFFWMQNQFSMNVAVSNLYYFFQFNMYQHTYIVHCVACISAVYLACLWSKMPMFQRAGMRKRGESLPLEFQDVILWYEDIIDLVMIYLSGFKMSRL